MERLHAYGLSLLLIGTLAYPGFVPPDEDGFPLSTYPMFSQHRPRVNEVVSAVAVGPGLELPLPPAYVANSEAMQAMVTLKKTLRAGKRASQALCKRAAARLAADADAEFARAERVELVTARLDSIDFLGGRATPQGRRVHARCPIER
jgi:hypothetical protein